MRKLATIRRIADLLPIEGADAIECAIVDGWKVVVKKGEFAVGDPCVYFEIDSVLPIREEFEFLRKGCYVKKDWLVGESNPTGEGFRLKTIKLRGQISQGLIVPIDYDLEIDISMSAGIFGVGEILRPTEGMDVTTLLGVVKWDPPVPATLAGKVKGNFPSFIPKTDQERIQNLKPADLEKYLNDEFEVTVKLDGSSMTVYHNNGKIGLCSRNLELDWENDSSTSFAQVFITSGLCEILPQLGNIAIQGELMGPGIQGNRENLKTHQFFIFDIYDIDAGRYLNSEERTHMLNRIKDSVTSIVDHCPVLPHMVNIDPDWYVDDFLTMAEGPSLVHPVREGLVFKSKQNPHFSFKVISNKFLLKGGE